MYGSVYGSTLISIRNPLPSRSQRLRRLIPLLLPLLVLAQLLEVVYNGLLRHSYRHSYNEANVRSYDITRSRRHSPVIRPAKSYILHQLETTGKHPAWYGSLHDSENGASPFDWKLPPEWLTPTKWLIVKQSAGEDEEYEELTAILSNIHSFTVHLCSPRNPPTACKPPWRPDIVLSNANQLKQFDNNQLLQMTRIWPTATHVHLLNACQGWNCTEQIFRLRDRRAGGTHQIPFDVVLSRHAFELQDIFQYNQLESRYGKFDMPLFAHAPYSADPQRYYPLADWDAKTIDTLDVHNILRSGPTSPSTRLESDYREARLCLMRSNSNRGMSREWVMAMLSGCVIVAEMPTESEAAVSYMIVALETDLTAEGILQLLEERLQDGKMLQRKALAAFMYARQHFVHEGQIGHILQLVEQHRAGVRGYDFPLPFSLECRTYADGLLPGWCADSAL